MPLSRCPPARFDADLNAAKEEANNEELAKSKLAMEKDTLQTDFVELQKKYKVREGLVSFRKIVKGGKSEMLITLGGGGGGGVQ